MHLHPHILTFVLLFFLHYSRINDVVVAEGCNMLGLMLLKMVICYTLYAQNSNTLNFVRLMGGPTKRPTGIPYPTNTTKLE